MLTLFFIFCIIAVIVVLLVLGNNSKNKNTYSLVDASRNGYLEKIKLLIENGADVNNAIVNNFKNRKYWTGMWHTNTFGFQLESNNKAVNENVELYYKNIENFKRGKVECNLSV